jgi:hypothetical protein
VDGRGKPVSPALISRLRTTLRAALNVAVKRGLLHSNPAVHVEVATHTRPPVQVWDAATTGRFLDTTQDTLYGPMCTSSRHSACAAARRLKMWT